MNPDSLVKDCIKRKSAAQKALYDFFAPDMMTVCYRYTKSPHDAQEILQEGFIKVFNRIKQYRGDGDVGAWIRKIIVNTAITYLKTNQKYRNELSYEEMNLHIVSSENPEVPLNAKELADLIRQLPTGFQTIFNLHAVEGYKHTEIAEILGISDTTSRSQYSRARKLLIEWIEKFSKEIKNDHYGTK